MQAELRGWLLAVLLSGRGVLEVPLALVPPTCVSQDLAPESLLFLLTRLKWTGAGRQEQLEARTSLGQHQSCPAMVTTQLGLSHIAIQKPLFMVSWDPSYLITNPLTFTFTFFFKILNSMYHMHMFLKELSYGRTKNDKASPMLNCRLPQVVQSRDILFLVFLSITSTYLKIIFLFCNFLIYHFWLCATIEEDLAHLFRSPLSLSFPQLLIVLSVFISLLDINTSLCGKQAWSQQWGLPSGCPPTPADDPSRHGEKPKVKGCAALTPQVQLHLSVVSAFFHPCPLWTCSSSWLCQVPSPGAPPLSAPHMQFRVHSPPLCLIYRYFPTTLHLTEIFGMFHPLIIPVLFFFLLLVFIIF